MRTILRVTGWLLVSLALFAVPVLGEATEENNGKALFEARCSACHPTSKPLGKTKTSNEWRETVTRMQQHAGGAISDEERETIIDYLSEIRGK
jgi:mono/diheme cytochrome c family protein